MHFSIGSYQKLGEIPRNLSCLASLLVVQLRVESQELVDLIAVLTVDFDLIEQWEIYVEVSLDVFLDFCVIPRFLSHELISRESEDLKSLGLVFLVEIDKLLVVI